MAEARLLSLAARCSLLAAASCLLSTLRAMDPIIREATAQDIPGIAAWTDDTFEWGDYVAAALPGWIEDPSGAVLVAELEGAVVAMGRVAMVSATEAWAQGARVHPEHRRRGLGTLLSNHLWKWASDRGAMVVRLTVEDDNEPALAQVLSMGFRLISSWNFASRALGQRSPVPEGNGGRRVPSPERLQPAHSAEAEPAYFSWSSGELARAARGLFPIGWVWRLMTVDHVILAARNHALWEGRPGWAILEEEDGGTRVHWLETAESDARAMVRALVDHGVEARATEIEIMVPAVEWLQEALNASAFDLKGLGIYALTL
jgi:ribosomal protein S18 acetylase RimI-like enzyme